MAANMQTPPDLVELSFAEDFNREKLPCPTCREGMQLRSLYAVPIDICEKHGIWFDANELASVLMRASLDKPAVKPFPL